MSRSYLRNAALHFISGRAASVAMVRAMLERRAHRRLDVCSPDPATRDLIEAVLGELSALGLLDDARFAEARSATLERKGLPRRRIAEGLRVKGVPEPEIAKAVDGGIDEMAQALRFIERKRLGPHRKGRMTPETRRKDLAALARAGFSFAIAARALDDDGEP